MSGSQTKNAALKTTLAFNYQVLVGLEQCFELKDGQSIWFEKDGDVSLTGSDVSQMKQTEVKNYATALTDHHENLWKTLKNWLAPEFKHENYGSLVLHTTQVFGNNTKLKDWNNQDTEQRLKTLQAIYAERTQEEIEAKKPKDIVKLQKMVMKSDLEKLQVILSKVVLFTEANDTELLRQKILSKLMGIPKNNCDSYLQALVGFVYDQGNAKTWEIKKSDFYAKCEELTTTYCKREFTFPTFMGNEASDKQVTKYQEKLFVKKIKEIKHDVMIPDAIGNWLELHNSLLEELDEYPLYRDKTEQYQRQLIKRLKLNHLSAQLNCQDTIRDSKIFYNQTMAEMPLNMGNDIPQVEYKNGLIHDALDNDKQGLRWMVKP